MYLKKMMEAEPYIWEGNTIFEPLKLDMTHGLLIQVIEVSQPTPSHHHKEIEQVYVIRSGRGLVTIDGETRDVEPDNIVFIPGGAEHCIAPAEGEKNLVYMTICHYM